VHERFTAEDVRQYKEQFGDIQVLAHPECPPDVLAEADFVGSTAGMVDHLHESQARRVVMITECSMSDNVAVEFPEIDFIRPCNLCPHMKRITLPKILRALQRMEHQIDIDPAIAERARRSVERMVAIGVRARD
jgi:quinolinate synthase